MSVQIPITNKELKRLATENNILFNRLPTVSDVGELPYTCDDIKLKANELINSRNINYAFDKIYTNLTYITSRCFTHSSDVPKSYLGLQQILGEEQEDVSRFAIANDLAVVETGDVDDIIGFISSPSSIGILSGGYTGFVCTNYNGGCFELDGADQNIDITSDGNITELADSHNLPILATNTLDGFNNLFNDSSGKYLGQDMEEPYPPSDICGNCETDVLFSALMLVPNRSFERVMQNTDDYLFSDITSISIDNTNNILFVLDEGMNTIFIYDTSGYVYGDEIFLKRDPQGRMYLGQIGGKDNSVLKNPKDIFVSGTKLYVFEAGDSDSAPRVKVFSTTSQSLLNTFSMYSLLPDLGEGRSNVGYDVNAGIVSGDTIFSIISNNTDSRIVQTNTITGKSIVTRLSFIPTSETPKQLRMGVNNSDSCYISTDKNIYKVHLTKLDTAIGTFDLTLIKEKGLLEDINNGRHTIGLIYVRARVGTDDEDEILVTFKDNGDLYRFADSNNYINVIRPEFAEDLYNLESVHIDKGEHVNALTYNHAFNKIFTDHISFINNLRGKFVSDEAATSRETGFRYISTQTAIVRAGLLKEIENIKTNINVGVNEFVLTAVVNRCLAQVCKLQEMILSLVEFNPDTDTDNFYVKFRLGDSKKINTDLPKDRTDNENPILKKCIVYSSYTLVTDSNFSIAITPARTLTNNNYTDESAVRGMLAASISNIPLATRESILENKSDIYFAGYDESQPNTIILSKTLHPDPIFTTYNYTDNDDGTITHKFGLGPTFNRTGLSVDQPVLNLINNEVTDLIISEIIKQNPTLDTVDSFSSDKTSPDQPLPWIQNPGWVGNSYIYKCFDSSDISYDEYENSIDLPKLDSVEFWIESISQEDLDRGYTDGDKYTGTDILFILDVSGSMSGERIENSKQYIIGLVNELFDLANNRSDLDSVFRIKLLTFSGGASQVSLAGSTDWVTISSGSSNQNQIIQDINGIRTGGGTNYMSALSQVQNLMGLDNEKKRRITFFLSDGKANGAGDSSENITNTINDSFNQNITLYPILLGSIFKPYDKNCSHTTSTGQYNSSDDKTIRLLEMGRVGQGLRADQKREIDFIYTTLSNTPDKCDMSFDDVLEKTKLIITPRQGQMRFKIKQLNSSGYNIKLPHITYSGGVRSINDDVFKFNIYDNNSNLLTDDSIRDIIISSWNSSTSDNIYMVPDTYYDLYFSPSVGCADSYIHNQYVFEVVVDLRYASFGRGNSDDNWDTIDVTPETYSSIENYSKDYSDTGYTKGIGSLTECKTGLVDVINDCTGVPSPISPDPAYGDYRIIPDNIVLPPNSALYRVNKLVNGKIEQKLTPGDDTFTDDGTNHYVRAKQPYGDYVILTWQKEPACSGKTYITIKPVDPQKHLLFLVDGNYTRFKGLLDVFINEYIDGKFVTTYTPYFVQDTSICHKTNNTAVRIGKNIASSGCERDKIYLSTYISEPVDTNSDPKHLRALSAESSVNLTSEFDEVWVCIKDTLCRS